MPVILLVDTGTSCDLFIAQRWCEEAGWPKTKRYVRAKLSDDSFCKGYWTTGYIDWLGRLREVEVFAYEPTSYHSGQRRKAAPRGDMERFAGSVGIGLLTGTSIKISGSEVEISAL